MELFFLFGLVCDEMFDMDLFVGPVFFGEVGGWGVQDLGNVNMSRIPEKTLELRYENNFWYLRVPPATWLS